MKYRVLITNRIPDEILAPLEAIAEIIHGPSGGDLMPRAEVLRHAPEVDAIINQAELKVDAELLSTAPKLKIVANVSLGADNLDLDLMSARNVHATNTPDAFADATADATLGLLLSAARRLAEADRYIRTGKWKGFQPGIWDGTLLRGKILGIIGFGAIGRAVAERARAFGMKIIFHNRTASSDPSYRSLETLLGESDFISLHTPLNAESKKILNENTLRLVKRGAFLINMARGKVCDEAALVQALKDGRLSGAGLDVFENEPAIHPELLTLENVVMTPHLGGGTRESRAAARETAVGNVLAVLSGRTPLTPLNDFKTAFAKTI